jgi:hypothetical protein
MKRILTIGTSIAVIMVLVLFTAVAQSPADGDKPAEPKDGQPAEAPNEDIDVLSAGDALTFWFKASVQVKDEITGDIAEERVGWGSNEYRADSGGYTLSRVLNLGHDDLKLSRNYKLRFDRNYTIVNIEEVRQVRRGRATKLTVIPTDETRSTVSLEAGGNLFTSNVDALESYTLIPLLGLHLAARKELAAPNDVSVNFFNLSATGVTELFSTVDVAIIPGQAGTFNGVEHTNLSKLSFQEGSKRSGINHTMLVGPKGKVYQWSLETGKVNISVSRVENASEARGTSRGHQVYGLARRDPFDFFEVLHRRTDGTKTPTGGGPEQTLVTAEDAQGIVKNLHGLLQLIKEDARQEGRDEMIKQRASMFYKHFDFLMKAEPAPGVDLSGARDAAKAYQEELKNIFSGAQLILNRGRDAYKSMELIFEDLRIAWSDILHDELNLEMDRLKKLGDDPEMRNSAFKPQMDQVIRDGESLIRRAAVIQDFQNVEVRISGIFYTLKPKPTPFSVGLNLLGQRVEVNTDLDLAVSDSRAIINGDVYPEGASILNMPELKVLRVEKQSVVFLYKGEEVSRILE